VYINRSCADALKRKPADLRRSVWRARPDAALDALADT